MAESSHFYNPTDASLVESVRSANGSLRPPTMRDAKKNGYYISFSLVKGLIRSFNLEQYKINAAIQACMANPYDGKEDSDTYAERMSRDAGTFSRSTADLGKEIHAQIEEFFLHKREPNNPAAKEAVEQISSWLKDKGLWCHRPESKFANHRLGIGGTSDLPLSESEDGPIVAIGDLKTRDLSKFKAPYEDDGMQLAFYALGFDVPNAMLVSIPIDRTSGECKFWEWGTAPADTKRHELIKSVLLFLSFWKMYKGYNPGEIYGYEDIERLQLLASV